MKKILKNIINWFLLVCISFTVLFVMVYALQNGGLKEIIMYKLVTKEKPIVYSMDNKQLEEISERYQQLADEAFKINESSNEKMLELNKIYQKYPVGITLFLNEIGHSESVSDLYIISIIISFFVGTLIFIILFTIKIIKQRNMDKLEKEKTIKDIDKK